MHFRLGKPVQIMANTKREFNIRTLLCGEALIIDLGTYKFKYLSTGKITPEQYFMNAYVEEVFESEHMFVLPLNN